MRAHVRGAVAVVVAALAVVAASCSSNNSTGGNTSGGNTSGGKSTGSLTIAFLMPCSTCADRFEHQDKPLFVQAVHAIDANIKVIANNAEGSSATQISQTESALTNGADVIVVSPLDESTGSAIVDKATAAKVAVLSYDGLITGAKADYYVSFDNEKVGELQGSYLAGHLPQGATVAFINGDQTIAPGRQFKAGAHKALDPLIQSHKLKLGYEGDAKQFDPARGQALMEQALTKLGDKVDGVLAANDGLAGGVVNALTARHLDGKVLVTGQDASDAGLQRVLLGQQSMTVYKAIKQEAETAAKIAVAAAQGDATKAKSYTTTSVDNGAGQVPSVLLNPVVVDKSNIAATVLADGFTTKDKLCTGDVKDKCPV